jgi:hypothetical protein
MRLAIFFLLGHREVLHQNAAEAFSATSEAGRGGLPWHCVCVFAVALGLPSSSTPAVRFFTGQGDPAFGHFLSVEPSIGMFSFEFLEAPSPRRRKGF